jgi:hypothetical protein
VHAIHLTSRIVTQGVPNSIGPVRTTWHVQGYTSISMTLVLAGNNNSLIGQDAFSYHCTCSLDGWRLDMARIVIYLMASRDSHYAKLVGHI